MARPKMHDEPQSTPEYIEDLKKKGIPVKRAAFHAAVDDSENVPQNYFSDTSEVKGRQADMLWTPAGLLVCHKGKYIIVPEATVKFAHLK